MAMKEKVYPTKQTFEKAVASLKKRLTINHPNLVTLFDYSAGTKSEFCSTFHQTQTFFEMPEMDARYAAAVKKKEGYHYSEGELTHMLYNMVEAGAHLQRNGVAHGNFQPQNIGVVNPKHYKLMDDFGDLSLNNQKQESLISNNRSHFTSPEKYRAVKTMKPGGQINPYKNDVFGLGLTMVELANTKQTKDIYRADGTLNNQALNQHLDSFNKKYRPYNNNLLLSTMDSMTDPSNVDRPDFIHIQKKLPEYTNVKSFLEQGESRPPPRIGEEDMPTSLRGSQNGSTIQPPVNMRTSNPQPTPALYQPEPIAPALTYDRSTIMPPVETHSPRKDLFINIFLIDRTHALVCQRTFFKE